MTEERSRRLSESSRVEAFSDGVFSIAITLLVLELAIPAVRDGFLHDLVDEWVSYIAYLAAFGSIGVLWMGHHTVFSRIRAVDAGLLWRNLVLLLTVSVVPFPTAVIASAFRVGSEADQAAAVVAYAVVGHGVRRRLAAAVQLPARPPEPRRPGHRGRISSGSTEPL